MPENFWGNSCEKSLFYAKKSYFFQLRREGREPGAPPAGSATASLDPSLYSDGVHFSDAGKRHLVRIIKFHLNPFIGLKPYNNYSPPANRKPAQFRNYKNDYSSQRNRQRDQRGKQYNRRNYVNQENEINRLVQQLVHISCTQG